MTDTQNVGTDAPVGAEGTPSQPVSPQAQAPIAGDVTQLLTTLEGKFSEQFTNLTKELRGLQGRQDRSENSFQQQLARLAQYEKQGMTRDEALAEMKADDEAASWRSTLEKKIDDLAAKFASGGTQTNQQQTVAKVFESIGLDVKDPRVAASLMKQYKDADQVELEAYRLQRQIQQNPNPNPAQSPALPGGGGNVSGIQAKIDRLTQLQHDPLTNQKEIKKLTSELDAANWGGSS